MVFDATTSAVDGVVSPTNPVAAVTLPGAMLDLVVAITGVGATLGATLGIGAPPNPVGATLDLVVAIAGSVNATLVAPPNLIVAPPNPVGTTLDLVVAPLDATTGVIDAPPNPDPTAVGSIFK